MPCSFLPSSPHSVSLSPPSSMAIPLFLTFLLLISSPLAWCSTIHDIFISNGLPVGLLPQAVKSFTLDDDGNLEVFLEKPCYAKFENRVFFDSVIKANLSYGELKSVAGLKQEELFIWLPVTEIKVDDPGSGLILFDVGTVHKQFSLSLFEDPPDCKPEEEEEGVLRTRSEFLGKDGKREMGLEEQKR